MQNKSFISILFCFVLTLQIFCQPIADSAFHMEVREKPLGMLKTHDRLVLMNGYNIIDYAYDFDRLVLRAYDNNFHPLYTNTISVAGRYHNEKNTGYFFAPMFKAVSTQNKGILLTVQSTGCSSQIYSPTVSYVLIDSLGQVVFTNYGYFSTGGAESINSGFFYKAEYKSIDKISPLTGLSTSTLYQGSDQIIAVHTNPKKQILFASDSSLTILDTLGSTLLNKSLGMNGHKLFQYKSGYAVIGFLRKKLMLLDSALNRIDSLALNANEVINYFATRNDSIWVLFHNNSTKISGVKLYQQHFSNLLSTSNFNSHGQEVVEMYLDDTFGFLGKSYSNSSNLYLVSSLGLNDTRNMSTNFSRFNNLNNLSYKNDIEITQVSMDSMMIDPKETGQSYTCHTYTYIPRIKVRNNSLSDTVRTFHLNHQLNQCDIMSAQCFAFAPDVYDTILTNLLIKPGDSYDIVLVKQKASHTFGLFGPRVVDFYFSVAVPNNLTESNLLNNEMSISVLSENVSLQETISTHPEIILYPNPVQSVLHFKGLDDAYTCKVYDCLGNLVLQNKVIGNEIDIVKLSSGVYSVLLSSPSGSFVKKFLKE